MASDVILLGDVADRGAELIEIRCGRCDRAGRLSVARLLAEHGPDAAIGHVVHSQVGDCPKRDASPESEEGHGRPGAAGAHQAAGQETLPRHGSDTEPPASPASRLIQPPGLAGALRGATLRV
jgi:hypothetical protein